MSYGECPRCGYLTATATIPWHVNRQGKPCVERPTRRRTASGGSIRPLLGPELHQKSRFHAAALGMSHSEMIRQAVRNFIAPKPAVPVPVNDEPTARVEIGGGVRGSYGMGDL